MSDKVGADEAKEIGLVDRVVDGDPVVAARDYIERLAQVSAPKAIAASKQLVYSHLGTGYLAALREAEAVQNDFVMAADSTEGAQSFIERRPPQFDRLGD